jgi:cell pole-organizing protein PopZ
MDDILASIRRILSDEEKAAKAAAPADGVFVLDPSMMVEERAPVGASEELQEPHAMTEPEPPPPAREPAARTAPEPASEPASAPTSEPKREPELLQAQPASHEPPSLVAPEAAAAAASSVGALMRTLAAERSAAVHRGGPTIEDLVRDEIRPLLKDWLDAYLPALVERLVRAEIERVVGRITG